MKKIVLLGASLLPSMAAAEIARAQAENYPAKPVRLIAPFPPGGSVDIVARLLGARLAESLGQQVIVDNRSGASGVIGTELVARAAPDGYTLLINTLPLVTNPYLFSRVTYDVVNDFAPISLLSSSPSVLAVHPSVPAHTVRELLQLAKARPGALNYATAGVGTNPHIAGELFVLLGKADIVAVHFKGGGPGLLAAISGEIDVTFSNVAESTPFVNSKRLRGLGVTSLERAASLPQLPPIAETIPGYEFVTWHGVLAPKGTPRAIITLLAERIRKILSTPEQAQLFRQNGLDIIASSPAEFATHLKREFEKWGRVIKERGIRAD